MTNVDDQDERPSFGVIEVPAIWRRQLDQAKAFAADMIEEHGQPEPETDGRELFDTTALTVAHVDRPEPPGKHWVNCAIEDPDGLQWLWLEFAHLHPRFGANPETEAVPRVGAAGCPRLFERFLWIRTGKPGWTVELVGGEVRVMVPRYPSGFSVGVSVRKVSE